MPKEIESLIGRKFGRWTVLSRGPDLQIPSRKHRKSGLPRWNCKCDCGNEYLVLGDQLRRGATSKCNLCRYKSRRLNGKISSRLIHSLKWGARCRGIEFDEKVNRDFLITLIQKQDYKCALSGLQISFANSTYEQNHGMTTASLDRIDSSKPYLVNNVQWVHKDINKMKMNIPQPDFIRLCKVVAKYNQRREK